MLQINLTDAQKRFSENTKRVRNIVLLYRELNIGQQGKPLTAKSDLLRASVVLLHASVEEFLRELARVGLVDGEPEFLSKIPISGSDGRAEKFDLGVLTKFKGKAVEDLIKESVFEKMKRETFNNPSDVKRLLKGARLDVDAMKCNWDTIGNVMARRHKIVHEADQNPKTGRGHARYEPVSQDEVNRWITAVEGLVEEIVRVNAVGEGPSSP